MDRVITPCNETNSVKGNLPEPLPEGQITLDNQKEMIAFKLASGETEQEVENLLNNLFRRGLEGKHLKVVASDGVKGIRAAISTVYP